VLSPAVDAVGRRQESPVSGDPVGGAFGDDRPDACIGYGADRFLATHGHVDRRYPASVDP
jgi:hypothetical protein